MGKPENGLGVFFYPPINYEEDEATYIISDYEIYINKNGYLAINTMDKEVAEDIFNSIFLSTSLLKGYAVWRTYNEEFEVLNPLASGKYISPRTFLGDSDLGPAILKKIYFKTIILEKKIFKVIINLSGLIYNSKFKIGILNFYDGYTKFEIGDHIGSFIINWLSIEFYISSLLENFLQRNQVFQNLIEKLNRDWSVYRKMEYLKENNDLDPTDFNRYNDQRIIRNKIIHSGYKPSLSEAKECKLIANDIMWKLFKMEGIDYQSYYDTIYK